MDRGRAHAYIEKAKHRVDLAWAKIRKGDLSPEPRALRVQRQDLVDDKERDDLLTQDIDGARERGQETDGVIAEADGAQIAHMCIANPVFSFSYFRSTPYFPLHLP